MNTAQDIKAFLSEKTWAMVGVSRNKEALSTKSYQDLKEKGYNIIPVNPLTDKINNEICYPSLSKIPEKFGGVLIFTPPGVTAGIVKEAYALGIKHIWIQQGAESDEAIIFCREKGLQAVIGYCIYMFVEPVRSYHAIHRWFLKIFGKIPH